MYVHIIDFHGVNSWYKIVETGRVPSKYEYKPTGTNRNQKVSVAFINSVGDIEWSMVNHTQIAIEQMSKPYRYQTLSSDENEKLMDNPHIEIRHINNLRSIVARVFNPYRQFYEHPDFINLTEEQANKHLVELNAKKPTISHILRDWTFLGNL